MTAPDLSKSTVVSIVVLVFSVLAVACLALVPLWFQSWALPQWDTSIPPYFFSILNLSYQYNLSQEKLELTPTTVNMTDTDAQLSFPERICIFRLYVKPWTKCRSLEQLLNNGGRMFMGRKVSSPSESSAQLASLLSPTDSGLQRDISEMQAKRNWNVT